jgi:hypothetical protein
MTTGTTEPSHEHDPLPEADPEPGQPDQGDNQDVPAERIYPTDPTGTDPA